DAARGRLSERCQHLRSELQARDVRVLGGSFGPIVAVLIGEAERALEAGRRLREQGLLVQAIRPPTVPPGGAPLRITVTARRPHPRGSESRGGCHRCGHRRDSVTQRIVLLGTGTGVGKTYFGVRLVESLVAAGFATLALKPIESGIDAESPEPTDAARLAEAS